MEFFSGSRTSTSVCVMVPYRDLGFQAASNIPCVSEASTTYCVKHLDKEVFYLGQYSQPFILWASQILGNKGYDVCEVLCEVIVFSE